MPGNSGKDGESQWASNAAIGAATGLFGKFATVDRVFPLPARNEYRSDELKAKRFILEHRPFDLPPPRVNAVRIKRLQMCAH